MNLVVIAKSPDIRLALGAVELVVPVSVLQVPAHTMRLKAISNLIVKHYRPPYHNADHRFDKRQTCGLVVQWQFGEGMHVRADQSLPLLRCGPEFRLWYML